MHLSADIRRRVAKAQAEETSRLRTYGVALVRPPNHSAKTFDYVELF